MVDLTSTSLFSTQPNLNNYVTIASVVSSQIPLANVFNGMKYLTDLLANMQASANKTKINFSQLNAQMEFKMYKPVKPKIIFSYYYSRVLPDNSQSQSTVSYQPVVQFKIDYDACCIGAMMCLLTTDIQLRPTIPYINVNGLTANGSSTGIQIPMKDVYSIQYSYKTDFIYHYINYIYIGFANTGGNAPVWHQQIPSEIIKIYQTILSTPAIAKTTARALREDQFVIKHNGNRQYGRKMFQIQSPASIPANTQVTNTGNNYNFQQQLPNSQKEFASYYELAMYWQDTEVMSIDLGNVTNQDSYSNQNNFQASFRSPITTGSNLNYNVEADSNKTQVITKLDLETEMSWKFGSSTAIMNLTVGNTIYQFKNPMQYLKIFSSQSDLAKYVYSGKFLENSMKIDPIQVFDSTKTNSAYEQIYLLPTIIYTLDDISFTVNLVSVSNTDGYAYLLKDGQQAQLVNINDQANLIKPIFTNSSVVTIEDGTNSGSMQYTLPNISGLSSTAVFTNILIAKQANILTCTQNSYIVNTSNTNLFVLGSLTGADGAQTYVPPTTFTTATLKTSIIITQTETNSNYKGYSNCIVTNTYASKLSIQDFTNQTSQALANVLLQTTGALSPLMKQANIAYINVVKTPYADNDANVNSMSMYKQSNGSVLMPEGPNALSIFRYNASIYANQQNEEQYPSFENPDYYSIHTYRSSHGIVDFYLPLQFLFICQNIAQSFPHYACAAQSIMIKFDFNNPLAFINTSIAINPLSMNQMDFAQKERILVNRVQPKDVLISNINNTKAILFYTRYAWVPQLINLMASYQYYSWVINNYERMTKYISVQNQGNQITLADFNKSNFYTRIWTFFVNKETLDVVNNNGAQLDYIPISINKFNLEPWDVMQFSQKSGASQGGASLTGPDLNMYNSNSNSVYYYTPVESIMLQTKTAINMTDELPYRFALLAPMLTLEHQFIGSEMMSNNMIQYNIDPIFYQEGFPFCMYSPAYAPEFSLKCKLKANQEQEFGVIVIPEYKNISYITQHIMLLKYSTNN